MRLYESLDFPYGWVKRTVMLSGRDYTDSSIMFHNNHWYLFTSYRTDGTSWSGLPSLTAAGRAAHTLCLFHSNSLLAGWSEHPSSPLRVGDSRLGRMGGRVINLSAGLLWNGATTAGGAVVSTTDQQLYRLGMDNTKQYGEQVFALQVLELSPTAYREKLIDKSVLYGGAQPYGAAVSWNANNMHSMDAQQIRPGLWLIAVDGCSFDN